MVAETQSSRRVASPSMLSCDTAMFVTRCFGVCLAELKTIDQLHWSMMCSCRLWVFRIICSWVTGGCTTTCAKARTIGRARRSADVGVLLHGEGAG